MKPLIPIVCLVTLAAALECPAALGQGGGVALYEVASPDLGLAYAGMGASAGDASTAYLNPAGMTLLKGHHLLLGFQRTSRQAAFHVDPATTTTTGSDRVDLGNLTRAAGLYAVFDIAHNLAAPGDNLKLGFALNAPFGLALRYGDDWAGRYFLQEMELATLNVNPSFAYRFNEWASFGFGLNIYYGTFTEKIAVNNGASASPADSDGQAVFDGDDWGVGFSFGWLVEPDVGTRVGVTYRSRARLNLKGKTTFHDLNPALSRVLDDTRFDTDLRLPAGINLSIRQQVTSRLALLFDLGVAAWTNSGRQPTALSEGDTTVVRTWISTPRLALGTQFYVTESWLLQGGLSFDRSPVLSEGRTPDMPVDKQWRFAAGTQKDLGEHMTLGLAYTFMMHGDGAINKTLHPLSGTLVGQYTPSQFHTLAATLGWTF